MSSISRRRKSTCSSLHSTNKWSTKLSIVSLVLISFSSCCYCSAYQHHHPRHDHDNHRQLRTIRKRRQQQQQQQQQLERKRLTQSLSAAVLDSSTKKKIVRSAPSKGKRGCSKGGKSRKSKKAGSSSSSLKPSTSACNKQTHSPTVSKAPSDHPSLSPSLLSQVPTQQPSQQPSAFPRSRSSLPSSFPSSSPSSAVPSLRPTSIPSEYPSSTNVPSSSSNKPTLQSTPNLTNSPDNDADPTTIIYVNQTVPAPTPATPGLPTNFWFILFVLASFFLFAITMGCFGALFCFLSKRTAGVIAVVPVPILTPTKEVEFETRSQSTIDTILVPESPTSTPPSSPPLHPSPPPRPISSNGGDVVLSKRSLSEIESNMGAASNTVEDETPVNTSLLENIVGINDWDAIVDDSHDHAYT